MLKPKENKSVNLFLQIIKVGIFITMFLPLFVDNNFLFPFVFPRTAVFRIIIEVCLALYLMVALLDRRYRPKWSMTLILISVFVGLMIITSLTGVDWYHSFWSSIERSEGIATWLHFLAFFIILVGIFKTQADWLQLFRMIILAGLLQTMYALGQIFSLPYAINSAGTRITGSLGNASFLATYLIFIIFITAYLITQTETKKIKLLYSGLILLDIFLIWQTQTRGAILSLLIGLTFLVGLKSWQNKKTKIIFIVLLFIAITLGVGLIANKNASWVKSNAKLHRLATISSNDISAQNRLIVWGVGWEAFKERPLLGWGWENFNAAFNHHFNPIITRDIGSQPWYDRAHNVVVETAVATGIFGLIIYLAIIGWAIKLLWPKQKLKKYFSWANFLLITLLITHWLQNLFVFDTLSSYILLFLVLAFIQSQQEAELKEKKPKKEIIQIKLIAATVLLVIITGPIIYGFNVKPALANYYLIEAVAKNKTNPAGMLNSFKKSFTYSPPNDRELRFILIQHTRDQINTHGINQETIPLIKFAIEETKKTIQVAPEAIQIQLLLAELYLNANALDREYLPLAEAVALAALKKAPQRYQVYTILGRIKISQNQFSQAIDYFKQAIQLNESFAEAHWNLAIAYILSWQPELARQSLDRAYELGYDIYTIKNINLLLMAFRDSKNLKATIEFIDTTIKNFEPLISPKAQNYQESLEFLEFLKQTWQELKAIQ